MIKQLFVNTGTVAEAYNEPMYTPLSQVNRAKKLIDSIAVGQTEKVFSNHPDFLSTLKYYGEQQGVRVHFMIEDQYVGDDLDQVFEELNRGLERLDELLTGEVAELG